MPDAASGGMGEQPAQRSALEHGGAPERRPRGRRVRRGIRLATPGSRVLAAIAGCVVLTGSATAIIAQANALIASCGISFASPGPVALLVISVAVMSASAGFLSWLVTRTERTAATVVPMTVAALLLVVLAVFFGYIGVASGIVSFGERLVSRADLPVVAAALGGPAVIAAVANIVPLVKPSAIGRSFLQGWMLTLALLVVHALAVIAATFGVCG